MPNSLCRIFLQFPIPAQDLHHLGDLRQDLETKLRVEASSNHAFKINLYKADIVDGWFKDYTIGQITPELIEKFREERKTKGLTNTTINQDIKILRKYLDIAVSKGYVKGNASRKITLLRGPKNRVPRCFYPEELTAFLRELPKYKHWLYGDFEFIVKALLYTGLRRSELMALRPDNIKIHLRQIHVQGKGDKGRIVGINPDLLRLLKKRMKKEFIIDQRLCPESLSRAVRMLRRKLNLPDPLDLHSLRHTYISYLLEKGVPTNRVKELAGHFSLAVTDRYTHALPKKQVDEDVLDFKV